MRDTKGVGNNGSGKPGERGKGKNEEIGRLEDDYGGLLLSCGNMQG